MAGEGVQDPARSQGDEMHRNMVVLALLVFAAAIAQPLTAEEPNQERVVTASAAAVEQAPVATCNPTAKLFDDAGVAVSQGPTLHGCCMECVKDNNVCRGGCAAGDADCYAGCAQQYAECTAGCNC